MTNCSWEKEIKCIMLQNAVSQKFWNDQVESINVQLWAGNKFTIIHSRNLGNVSDKILSSTDIFSRFWQFQFYRLRKEQFGFGNDNRKNKQRWIYKNCKCRNQRPQVVYEIVPLIAFDRKYWPQNLTFNREIMSGYFWSVKILRLKVEFCDK